MVNITNVTNIDGIYSVGQVANDSTEGLFWGVLLIGIFIILLTRFMNSGMDKAVAGASFSCLLISLILFRLSWVSLLFPLGFTFLLAGALFYIKYVSGKSE